MEREVFSDKYPFKNPPLPYGYDSLEPYIDSKTMHLHHDKHLEAYVDNLNKALSGYQELWGWSLPSATARPCIKGYSLHELIINADTLPKEIETSVLRNAGGVYNHVFYFQGMTENKNEKPSEEIAELINKSFGDYDGFKSEMKDAALGVFGSGYAWLGLNDSGKLCIIQTSNQDTPLTIENFWSILNIDVWEHAYYLKNYNKRNEYIDNWFNVINWNAVQCRMQYAERMNALL